MRISWRALGAWIAMSLLLLSVATGTEKKPSSPDRAQLPQASPAGPATLAPEKSHRSPGVSPRDAVPQRGQMMQLAPGIPQRGSPSPYALHLPDFVLSEVYYFDPGTGTKYQATKQGNTWVLPVVDTLQERPVTFLFSSNVPRADIADVVLKRACCYQLLVSNQSLPVKTITFSGDRVFLWASVPDMQGWPKTVQLRIYDSGGMATPADASRAPVSGAASPPSDVSMAPSSIHGMPPASAIGSQVATMDAQKPATAAPIIRPAMDYKSTPVSIQGGKVSYFAEFLYPTFSHERCTDCHSMGDKATVEKQHEVGGVTGVNGTYTHQAGCGGTSCHNFVKDWRTPPFALGINWKGKSAKEICTIVTSHLPTAQGLHSHFHDDPRVIWAVSDGWVPQRPRLPTAPPHNAQAWLVMVDEWIDGGFPCPE